MCFMHSAASSCSTCVLLDSHPRDKSAGTMDSRGTIATAKGKNAKQKKEKKRHEPKMEKQKEKNRTKSGQKKVSEKKYKKSS